MRENGGIIIIFKQQTFFWESKNDVEYLYFLWSFSYLVIAQPLPLLLVFASSNLL